MDQVFFDDYADEVNYSEDQCNICPVKHAGGFITKRISLHRVILSGSQLFQNHPEIFRESRLKCARGGFSRDYQT